MATPKTRLITVTDDRGRIVLPEDDRFEPAPASVVLINGPKGTAFQRHGSDGKWYRLGDRQPKTWGWLLRQRNVVLVYETDE